MTITETLPVHSASTEAFHALQARRVKEEDNVTEMSRKSRRLQGVKVQLIHVVAALAIIGTAVAGVLMFKSTPHYSEAMQRFESVQLWVITGALVLVALLLVFMGESTPEEELKAKRRVKHGIRKSRGTAKHLGSSIVPVLTSFHVDARINVDETLKTQIESRDGAKWNQADSDAIALLLFEDLGREQVILSLINDRGLVNATEIAAELEHIESSVAAPLWEGML